MAAHIKYARVSFGNKIKTLSKIGGLVKTPLSELSNECFQKQNLVPSGRKQNYIYMPLALVASS